MYFCTDVRVVKEGDSRSPGEIRVGSNPTPCSIRVSRSLIEFKRLHGMRLGLEYEPLEGVGCLAGLGRRNGRVSLHVLTVILFGFYHNGLHLKIWRKNNV